MKKFIKASCYTAFILSGFITPAEASIVTGATPSVVITDYLDQNDKPGIDSFITYSFAAFNTIDAKLAAQTGRQMKNILSVREHQ